MAKRVRHAGSRTPFLPDGPLKLRLSTTLQWPAQPQEAVRTTGAVTAMQPDSAAPRPPVWLGALLTLLQHDESGQGADNLKTLVAEHGAELVALRDADLSQRLGWWAMRQRQPRQAMFWFEQSLTVKPEQAGVRFGLALALRESGQLEAAYDVLASDSDAKARDMCAALALELALAAQSRQDTPAQIRWLERAIAAGRDDAAVQTQLAWALFGQGRYEQATQSFGRLHANQPDPDNARGLYLGLKRLGRDDEIDRLARQHQDIAALLNRERAQRLLDWGFPQAAAALGGLDDAKLSGLLKPDLSLGSAQRSKSGSEGTSRLQIHRSPDLVMRWPDGSKTWELDMSSIRLDAGVADPSTPAGSALVGQPPAQTHVDAGWEPRLRWSRQGETSRSASLGLTPMDGPVSATVTGELGWKRTASGHELGVRAYAEPVRDSILSYVGLRDPASGQSWGRVLRYGFGAEGYAGLAALPGWNLGGSVALETLRGHHVEDNAHGSLSLGLNRDLPVPGMRFFSLGPGLGYERYAHNLSNFTWGQGGYFSPRDFTSAGLNLLFQTEDGRRFIARGQAGMGWQSVTQAASPCFPLTPPVAGGACADFAPSRLSGVGTSTELNWAYLLSPHWELGGNLGWRTGPAYHDHVFYLGLRYNFGDRSSLFGTDLSAILHSLW